MRTRLVALGVLVAIAVAACGSDTPSAADDLETAKKVVLVAADFPPGWTSEPDDEPETPEDRAASQEINRCIGASGDESETAEWSGDDFTMGPYEVGTASSVVKSKAIFRDDVEAIKGPKVQTCLKDAFTKVLTEQLGAAPTSVEAAPLPVDQYGDVTVGVRITATLSAGGETANIYADAVLIGKNRAETTTSFFSLGEPIDPALQKSLIAKVGAKVDAL